MKSGFMLHYRERIIGIGYVVYIVILGGPHFFLEVQIVQIRFTGIGFAIGFRAIGIIHRVPVITVRITTGYCNYRI